MTWDVAFYCSGIAFPTPGRGGVGVVLVDAAGESLGYTSRALENADEGSAAFAALDAALAFAAEREVRTPVVRTSAALVVATCNGNAVPRDARADRIAAMARRRGASVLIAPESETRVALALARRAVFNTIFPGAIEDALTETQRALDDTSIDPEVRHLHRLASDNFGRSTEAVVGALRAFRVGRSPYSTMKEEDARRAALQRHGETAVDAMEAILAVRSPATRLKALRWAARGLAPALVAGKLEIERAETMPYRLRFAGRQGLW